MLVYKCDGDSFSTAKKCSNEVARDIPEWWLTITGSIKNGLHDAHYIEANGTYHFCSRRCFETFLFKDLNAASATTGNSNMNIDPRDLQPATQEEASAAEVKEQPAEQATEATENTGEGALVD